MLPSLRRLLARPGLRRRALVLGIAGLAIWLVFLDGHSLLTRLGYVREHSALSAEIEELRSENEALEERLRAGLTEDVVEEVAREQYGMRRPGETVYPVEHLQD
jgi:cell division protein FtsB